MIDLKEILVDNNIDQIVNRPIFESLRDINLENLKLSEKS